MAASAGAPQGTTFKALYDFNASDDDELGFKAGEIIIGATQEGEWWSGSRAANPEVVGLFPGNYVERVEGSSVAPDDVRVRLVRVESWKPKRRDSMHKPVPAFATSGGATAAAGAGASAGGGGGGGSAARTLDAMANGSRGAAKGGGGGGAAKKRDAKPKGLPLAYGVWGHYMGKIVGPWYFFFGLANLVWATSPYAELPEIADTNASVLIGLFCMAVSPVMIFVEHKWPMVLPLLSEYKIPFRGMAYIGVGVPALFSLPTLIVGTCAILAGLVNTYAVLRGEVGTGVRRRQKKADKDDDEEDTRSIPVRIAAWWKRQREADNVGQLVVLTLYTVGNFWYGIDTLVVYFDLIDRLGEGAPSYWAPFAKLGGALLNLNCSMLLLPIARGLLQILNRQRLPGGSTLATYLPLRKNVGFHKMLAKVVAASASLHIVCHFFNFAFAPKITLDLFPGGQSIGTAAPWYGSVRYAPWVTGALITLAMFFIFSAAPKEVKQAKYELFWNNHHFFILFYVNLIFHGPVFLYWSILPITLYVLERIFRVRRGMNEVFVLSVKWIDPVLCLSWKPKYKEKFQFVEGQYLYLCCPFIASDEWHPFTISSARGDLDMDDYVTVHIRVYPKGWTGKLKDYLELMNPTGAYPLFLSHIDDAGRHQPGKSRGPDGQQILKVDGPHAAPAMHYDEYDTVMLVGAGIGLTPSASIIRAILRHKWRKGFKPEIIHFYWIVRQSEIASFQWFVQLLTELQAQLDRDRATANVKDSNYIEMNIYVTRAEDSYPTPPLRESAELSEEYRPFAAFTPKQLLEAMVHPKVKSRDQVRVQASPMDAANRLGEIWVWNGRPDWDAIFAEVARRRMHKDIGVCFCGAYVIGKDLAAMCVKHSDVASDVHFHLHKENF